MFSNVSLLFLLAFSLLCNEYTYAYAYSYSPLIPTTTTRKTTRRPLSIQSSTSKQSLNSNVNLNIPSRLTTSPLFAEMASNPSDAEGDTNDDENDDNDDKSAISRFLNAFKPKGEKMSTKELLAKMGLSTLLSYGFVSNMGYCVTVSAAWFTFTKKTGLSPLAPGQWKRFLAVYAGFYVFNNFIRPIRIGMSVGVSKYFDAAISNVQRKLNVSKPIAIGLVVFFVNIVGTTTLMCSGIWVASALAGVPVFPPKVIV